MSEIDWDAQVADAPTTEDVDRQRQVRASQGIVREVPAVPVEAPDWADVTRDAPTTQALIADPARAIAVKDEVPWYAKVERLFRGWRDIGWETAQAWKRGRAQDRISVIGWRQAQGIATPDEIAEADRLEALMQGLAPVEQGLISGIPAAVAESAPMMLKSFEESGETMAVGSVAGAAGGAAVGGVFGGVGALPGAVAGFAGGAGIGAKVGMVEAVGKREGGGAYREYMKIPGVTHEQAKVAATIVGLVNGGLEVLPLEVVLQIPGMKALARGAGTRDVFKRILRSHTGRAILTRAAARIAESGLLEGLTEAAQEITTVLGGQVIDAQPGVEIDWPRVVEAGVKGAQGGVGMAGVGVAAGGVAEFQEGQRVRERVQFFTELGKAAAESTTVKENPEIAAGLIQQIEDEKGTGNATVSVPVEKLVQLFQSNDVTLEQVAKRMPSVAKQIEEASGNPGVEIAIPTADFATTVAPLNGYDSILPDLRVGDGLTLREVEKVEAEAKKIAESEKEAAAKPVEQTPEAKVYADVASKLEAVGQPTEGAALWAAFSRVMAERTGAKDAFEFYKGLNLDIEHADLAEKDQGPATADELTGARTQAEWLKFSRRRAPGFYVAIDVNDLKRVNDTLGGHAAGNELLKAIAGAVGPAVQGQKGKFFRTGGDEFVAHFRTEAEAQAAAKAMQDAVGALPAMFEGKHKASISAGVGKSPEIADQAAMKAKERARAAGRSGFGRPGAAETVDLSQGDVFLEQDASEPLTQTLEQKVDVTGTPEFKAWFRESKVVDEQGNPRVVYHGARRPDRIGNRFRKSRATSGPMAFFTTDTEIASKYATGKADTSLEAPDGYSGWFKAKVGRSTVPVDRLWYFLTPEKRAEVAAKLPHVVWDNEDGQNAIRLGGPDEYGLAGKDHWDFTIQREARGNVLRAAVEIWLNSASLFDQEERFIEVLRAAGVDNVEYDSPHAEYPGVIPVFLSIQKPLDTAAIPEGVVAALDKVSKRKRASKLGGADVWDKRNRSGAQWMQSLREDIESGSTHAWTSIPDWVTETLIDLGYDGIHDTGGKGGGKEHEVWIPFQEGQVKSATGNRGTFDPNDPNILHQPGAPGTARGFTLFPQSREWFKITLNGTANLSTFLHESGHVFLEVMRQAAASDPKVAADLDILKAWLGTPLTGEFQQDQLERFARGFESYLREGKAPSSALADVFATFKAWLVHVYRTLRGLDVTLTDEVRGVMDRMLATEAEIAEARKATALEPAFATAEEAGMSPSEFEAYRARWAKVQDEGARELMAEKLAGLARQMGEERAAVRADVAEAADSEPVFRLRDFLRTGETGGDANLESLLDWARGQKAQNIVTTLERSKADRRDPRLARLRVLDAALGGDAAVKPSRTRAVYFSMQDGAPVEYVGSGEARAVVLPDWLPAGDYLADRTAWDLTWTLLPRTAPKVVQGLVADRVRAAIAAFPTTDEYALRQAYVTAKLFNVEGAPTAEQAAALEGLRAWLAKDEDARPESPVPDRIWNAQIDTREGREDASWKWAKAAAADIERGTEFTGRVGPVVEETYDGEEGALRKERDAIVKELAAEQRVKIQLDHEAVASIVGTRGLSRLRGLTAANGVDPDMVAPYFQFRDGAEMVQALASTSSREAWVRAETSRRMAAKYPEGAVVAKPDRAAAAAAHTGALRALESEWRAMGTRLGKELPRAQMETLRRAAKARVAQMTDVELKPDTYRRAARAASKEATESFVRASKSLLKGRDAKVLADIDLALDAKRRQVWNTLMGRETAAAKAEVERVRAYLRGFEDIGKRRRIGKAGQRYIDALDALLDGLQLRRESLRAVRKRQSLAVYVTQMEAEGDVVAPALKELADLKSYREMTVEELEGVEAAAANIEAMAGLKGKLLINREKRDLANTAATLAEHIRANRGTAAKPTPGDLSLGEKSAEWFRSADAEMKKVEFIARILDGGKTAGFAHSLLFQPLRDAQNARYLLQEKVHGALMQPFKDLDLARRRRYAKRVAFLYSPKAGKMVSLSMRNVLSVVLNMGNEGNRERLLKGYGWSEAQVIARLDQLLDDGDVQIVNHVWRSVNALWPDIQSLSQRTVGLAPKKVEATPFTLPSGKTLEGGYYPIVKSRRMSYLGQQIAEQENALKAWEANFFAPVVEHGFTKSRGRDMSPLDLSLDVVPSHLDKVIHYVTHYEATRAVDRLVQRGEVREAITEGLGREYYNQLRPWLENIAADGNLTEPLVWYERVFRHLRFGSSVVLLFGKIPTGIKQGLGFFTSAKDIKRRHMVSGLRKFLREGWGEVREQSPEFKFIDKQLDRDARELFTSLDSSFTELGGLKRHVAEYGAAPIMLVQKTVNAITWYAAREQAIEEGHPNPVAYADSIVSMTQTGGGAKDLAAVQRGSELRKMFTVMFSYRSVLYNLLTEQTGQTGEKALLTHAARFWWLVFLPVIAEQLLMNGIPDKEDPDETAKRLALEMALLPASTVPVFGDAFSAGAAGREARGAPWVDTIYRTAIAAGRLTKGDDLRKTDTRALVDLVGSTTQMPTAALWNYGAYLDALLSGDLEEPVQDLLFRNPSKWE